MNLTTIFIFIILLYISYEIIRLLINLIKYKKPKSKNLKAVFAFEN